MKGTCCYYTYTILLPEKSTNPTIRFTCTQYSLRPENPLDFEGMILIKKKKKGRSFQFTSAVVYNIEWPNVLIVVYSSHSNGRIGHKTQIDRKRNGIFLLIKALKIIPINERKRNFFILIHIKIAIKLLRMNCRYEVCL